jgi:hypothetical protein
MFGHGDSRKRIESFTLYLPIALSSSKLDITTMTTSAMSSQGERVCPADCMAAETSDRFRLPEIGFLARFSEQLKDLRQNSDFFGFDRLWGEAIALLLA